MATDRDKNDRFMSNTRHYIDVAMGALYIFIGIYVLRVPGIAERFGSGAATIFLGLFCAYGLYRMCKGLYSIFQMMKTKDRRRNF
jgi:hypothetical protein